ncbi:MAG TPA: amidase [Steroidobacteraceae bacterium]
MAFSSTTALVEDLRSGRISALAALEQAIGRIEARDGEINAVVVKDFERARAAAVAADAALARGDRRPLLGVPMTVKESFNVAGLPTTWGVPATAGTLPRHDAVAVARLKASGAVILGKTNVATYLGDWQSVNAVYGRTRNPWDLGRTPGGSSGGAAAALAAGFVSLEMGSDLFGSLRIPAYCCGVFAHRPTHGLIPARGHAPPGTPELSVGVDTELGVVGPLARTAGDLMLALDVLAGPDDAQAAAYRLALPAARHARLRDFRVLVLEKHPLVSLASEVGSAMQRFAGDLRGAGATVGDASPLLPDLTQLAETFGWLLMALLGATYPDEVYASRRERAARLPAEDRSREAGQARALVSSHRDWARAQRTRIAISHQWRQLFREWDVVICPVLPTTAFPHDDTEMSRRTIDVDGQRISYGLQAVWSGLSSLSGLPATAMPIGPGSGGLPIGVQIIGPYLEDRTTLEFARLAEREFGGYRAPPGFS